MKWITWEQVGVDRMGCAWLTGQGQRIDPQAEFLFVPPGQPALPPTAEPFDLPGVRLSHRGGHSSFHTFLREYDLRDPVLERIARIIDEADVVQALAVEPVAPGLDFICRGLRLSSPDDLTALERGAMVYDALYAQLSAETQGPT
jgi:hypothetical protein